MKYFLALLLLMITGTVIAQNLLLNGDFEDKNICTEYNEPCAPEAWIATSLRANYYFRNTDPIGVKSYRGVHFIGLTAGNLSKPDLRNYIRTRLLCGLQRGHQYQLTFYTCSPQPVLDSVGIYFTAQDFLYEVRSYKRITPQLWVVDGRENPNTRDENWQKVQLTYTANGTEAYLVIGNFKIKGNEGITDVGYKNDYYFYIDDIALTPLDPDEMICPQADSVRYAIYRENDRHEYIDKKYHYYYRQHPNAEQPSPPTVQKKKPVIKQRIDTLIVPDIFFTTASYELNQKSFHLLDSFATRMAVAHIDSLVIEGHTDSVGKQAYNEALSLNRALSVKKYLQRKVASVQDRTITRGLAYSRPIATNKTPKGRQLNRRVEVLLYRRSL